MQAVQQQAPPHLKEQPMEGKPSVNINAAAGAIASSQERYACKPQNMDNTNTEASPTATPEQHLSPSDDSRAMTDSLQTNQAGRPAASDVITVQIAVGRTRDTESFSYSSSPDSRESIRILKPLTPAQSSEHSPGSSNEEQCAVMASRLASAEAPQLSCEVCNISTTSTVLLQQHLQGRRHMKILAVQNPGAEADARYELLLGKPCSR